MKVSNLFCLGLGGCLLGVSSGSAETIFDDFNDGEDSNPPWTLIDASALRGGPPGERTFGSDNMQYRLRGAALASIRTDFVLQNGTVRVELNEWVEVVEGDSSIGLFVRFQQDLSGYFMSIDLDGSPQLNLVRLDNGAPTDFNDTGENGLTLNPANTYILEAEATGSNIAGRLYEKVGETVTLVDDVLLVDTAYPAGLTGLLVANNNFGTQFAPGDATFDNYFATDGNIAQPELANSAQEGQDVTFGVQGEAGREYTVEYKDSVDAVSWSVLTTLPPSPFTAPRSILDSADQPQRIYRASTPED